MMIAEGVASPSKLVGAVFREIFFGERFARVQIGRRRDDLERRAGFVELLYGGFFPEGCAIMFIRVGVKPRHGRQGQNSSAVGLDHHPDSAPRAHPADLGAQFFFDDILKHLINSEANVRARTRGHENPRFGMNRPSLRVALDADAAHAPAHVLLVGLLHAVHARIINADEADQRGCEFTLGIKPPALGDEAEAVDPQFFDSSLLIGVDFPLQPHISAAAVQFF